MKTFLIFLFALVFIFCNPGVTKAATVTFTMTNSVGAADTNRILIRPVSSYVNSDGSVQTTGFPFWITPNASGFVQTNLNAGNYLATNSFLVSSYGQPGTPASIGSAQGVLFAVPNSSGVYPFGQLAISGYNTYNYNPAINLYTNVIAILGYTPPTFAQVTNIASAMTNSLASTNFVNSAISAATNGLATTNELAQYLSNSQFLTSSNSIVSGWQTALIATNNALTNQIGIAYSNAVQVSLNSSNALQSAKQPASTTLSNLSATGAFTNQLAAGANVNLTTNFGVVSINATNQTFLTNGLASTNFVIAQASITSSNDYAAATNYYGVQSAATATTNFVISIVGGSTNGLASINFVTNLVVITSNSLASAFQSGTNWINTNLTSIIFSIGANGTNNTLAVSNSLSIASMNNATNAAKAATNGLPAFVWGLGSASQSNVSAFITPYQLGTNLAAYVTTNQLNSATSSVVQIDQAFSLSIGQNATNNDLVTSNGVFLASSNLMARATNNLPPYVWGLGSASQSNASAFYLASNPSNFISGTSSFVKSTNGYAQQLILDSDVIFQSATNIVFSQDIIGVRGAQVVQANGTYRSLSGSLWTNYQSPGFTILLTGGNYYIRTNATSLYLSPVVNTNWTTISSGTAPVCAYGFYFDVNGVVFTGIFDSSNITSQVVGLINNLALTNNASYPVTLLNPNNQLYGVSITGTNINALQSITLNGSTITVWPSGSGTNGSATNIFFFDGRNTHWTTLNNSNVVDVVGTLTNNTTGNASTATTALALNSATTTVVVNGATAPSAGQVLTATSSTAANWQTPSGGGGTTNQMVFQGTNNPNGVQSAPMGAIYNQFYVGTSNFIGQWINTNGITGWQ